MGDLSVLVKRGNKVSVSVRENLPIRIFIWCYRAVGQLLYYPDVLDCVVCSTTPEMPCLRFQVIICGTARRDSVVCSTTPEMPCLRHQVPDIYLPVRPGEPEWSRANEHIARGKKASSHRHVYVQQSSYYKQQHIFCVTPAVAISPRHDPCGEALQVFARYIYQ